MKILVTGGTGMLGQELCLRLVTLGHSVRVLTRDPEKQKGRLSFPGELVKHTDGDPLAAAVLDEVDAVVHLAGESVGEKSWTPEQKQKILDSRTRFWASLGTLPQVKNLKVILSASGIGFYGDRGDEDLSETSSAGSGFLTDVCQQWEQGLWQLETTARKASLRTGLVLHWQDGVLDKLTFPAKMGANAPLGTGKQWLSWIHIEDWVSAVVQILLQGNFEGPVNLVAPEPLRFSEFVAEISKRLGSWMLPKVPASVLKIVLGERAHLVLDSQKVLPAKLVQAGFQFQFPTLTLALADLLGPLAEEDQRMKFKQWVPGTLDSVFVFYSNENNLEKITPPYLNFQVLGKNTPEIQSGTLIDYRLKLHGIPMRWRTQIEDWSPPTQFRDRQLQGPYSVWDHLHTFKVLGNGVLMEDTLKWKLPLGQMGRWAAFPFVRKDVKRIFDYRKSTLVNQFFLADIIKT